jgi:hypothetical protein
MVEVFKTNVFEKSDADKLLNQIHFVFGHCRASFDLEDCDKILRVTIDAESIQSSDLIALLKFAGFSAEVLSDETTPEKYPASIVTFSIQ